MSTKTRGEKLRQTMIAKYGSEEAWRAFMGEIGKIGGQNGHTGGFAYDDRSLLDRFMRKPKRAVIAGRKGGYISKRGPTTKQRIINDMEII